MSAGISLRSLAEGVVPIQEEHQARLERGIGLAEWSAMDIKEKALLIAVRRVAIANANIQQEAELTKSDSEMKRVSQKGK